MKTLSGIMSNKSKEQYLESCRARYPSRNRAGKSKMIDEVSDTLGWDRKHTIKALNGKVSLGKKANKRGSKPTYQEAEKSIIVELWKLSEQPCGKRLKSTLPLWLKSYEKHYKKIPKSTREKVLRCSQRQLDRITAPHRVENSRRYGRSTGRTSHRLKSVVAIQCGPQDVDRPGWMEADTVSHGGGSSSGQFMWSLTLTDIYSGWTELSGLWGNSGGEVCVGLRRIEERMPFEMLGFDCDNGSEFLNTMLESYLLNKTRNIKWTRSRPYKKNDQAHVEQKNFTHVRQLLGYGRYSDIKLVELVNDLYETAWLPLRNYFTPVMKLVEKKRQGSKVIKKYDEPQTPCDRLLKCDKVSAQQKFHLKETRAQLDPIELARNIEEKLQYIHSIIEQTEKQREQEDKWLEESAPEAHAGTDCAPAPVAIAPSASTPSEPAKKLAKTPTKQQKQTITRVS
jgi:hypothetical protein